MPRATVSTATERFELKSCPEGFVELRRMSYGEKMTRQAEAAKMKVLAQRGKNKSFEGEMNMMNEKVRIFEFTRCIVEHNLEDELGNKLDLGNPDHVRKLDGKIGEEIDKYIGEMNNFDDDDEDDELGN